MKKLICLLALASLGAPTYSADRVELVQNLSRSGENPTGKLIIASDGKFYGTTRNGGTNGFGSIYRFDNATGTISTLASFGSSTGKFPNGELLDGADGFLYGTAKQGGTTDFGTIFRFKLSDGSITKLAQFDGVSSGKFPLGGLAKVGSRYYGVASDGGASNSGTVFKLTPVTGSTNWDLGAFSTFDGTNGKKPWGTLVDSGGGVLLGTTELGGTVDRGVVYKVATSGATLGVLQVIKTFAGGTSDGANPRAGLWKSKADGFFYGTTFGGGTNNIGTVYRLNSVGTTIQVVTNMELAKGSKPQGTLVEPPVADGFLYGTCSEGGANGVGAVFKVGRDSVGAGVNAGNVASFNTTDGRAPLSGLVFGADGLAYGTTDLGGVGGLGGIFRITPGVSLRSAASFVSNGGANPRAALSAGPDGVLYGTTFDGGATADGTVFRVKEDGTFSTVATFSGADGANPLAPLIVATDGTIFGSTYKGGSNERGTLFRLTTDGTIQPLIKFAATVAPKGTNPRGAMVRVGNDFFGVTEKGGVNDRGTIFKVSVNTPGSAVPATLTTLLDFNGTNGEFPFSGLTDGGDGSYYGTTTKGGANGFGTFFKVSSAGTHTKLYDFTSANPTPVSTLVKDASTVSFYGTSDPSVYEPAAGTGNGTIYKLTGGAISTLHTFTGNTAADGRGPRAVSLIGSNQLAGVTYGGGGSLFSMPIAGGTPTTIYRFDDNYTGALSASRPEAALFVAPDGAIYGNTQKSSFGGGVIYRLLNSPTAAIASVTETSADAAIARGFVNPNGETVSVFFEYSTLSNFNLAQLTTAQTLSGTTLQQVGADLTSLDPGTPYFVRLRAGSRTSATFIYGTPLASTGAAIGVGALVATVRGTVNPNGRDTTVQVQYGATVSYGSVVTLASVGNGSEPVAVEADLAGLTPASTYHYRIVATNGTVTSNGADAIFVTGSNSAPEAIPLFGLSTSLTAPVTIDVPSNLDPDNEVVTIAIENQPSFGGALVVNNNRIVFSPNASFKGLDSLTYSVTDPGGAKSVGTVTIRNPFALLKGSYFTYLTNAQGEPLGSVKITVGATGSFTGSLAFGGSFPLAGAFDPATGNKTGIPTITIRRAGKPPLTVTLRLDTASEKGTLGGTVNDGTTTNGFNSDARLLRSTELAPQAGRYTVWFRPPEDNALPQGNGWATLVVSTKGLCTMAGKAGDGTAFTAAPTLRTTDSILVNIPLFATQPITGRGYLFGELTFRNKPGSDADGGFKWKRGPQPASLYYPAGFGPESITVQASRWLPLTTLPGTHQIDLVEGGLADNEPNNLPAAFSFLPANVTTGIANAFISSVNLPETVKFSTNFKTGAFTGSFVHPDVGATKPRAFSGVLYQKQNTGVGVFLGTSTSGGVEIDLQ
jgi:uncharacterized repeat protein (TIGR03803 family)